MKVLVTGFNAFGNVGTNPSQTVVEELERRKHHYGFQLLTAVLPTEFIAAGELITQLIKQHESDVVMMLGVSANSQHIALERFALNIDDTTAPDNSGYDPVNQIINPTGPIASMGNFPLLDIAVALTKAGIPVVIFNHAGTYVCNHVYYVANEVVAEGSNNTLCGFIHIPLPRAGFGMEEIVGAVEQVTLYLTGNYQQ